MKNSSFETLIGAVVIFVAILFLFVASKIADGRQKITSGYNIIAEFTNAEGVNIGSDVKISGVKIGNVVDVKLNKDNYNAVVVLKIPKEVLIPTDSIFKISTSGLIGNKFINVKLGADEDYFKNNEVAEFTESIMDLEDLISRFIFNSRDKNEKNK